MNFAVEDKAIDSTSDFSRRGHGFRWFVVLCQLRPVVLSSVEWLDLKQLRWRGLSESSMWVNRVRWVCVSLVPSRLGTSYGALVAYGGVLVREWSLGSLVGSPTWMGDIRSRHG